MPDWLDTTQARALPADQLAELSELARSPSIERALEAVRELLGMEVAYATEMTEVEQHFKAMSGDAESFGLSEGTSMPVEATYCSRILAGRLPNLIADVCSDDRAASMPVTEAADVGAFASVPLRLSTGELYGTLCAASHDTKLSIGYRELQFLHVFARIVSDQIEREMLDELVRSTEVQAAAVGVSDAILGKPGPLDEQEWEQMRCHPVYGERLVREIPGLGHLGPAIRAEHERWDGKGYPDRLAAGEIPLASRITLVCDAYHAMTSDRPYRAALTAEAARAEVEAALGTQFCPTAGAALLELLD